MATGVLGLKKASQFALIWATAADVDAAVVLAEALGLAPLLLLLLHAVTAMTAPRANIRKTLVGCNRNRMGALLWLERRTEGPQRGHGGRYRQLRWPLS